MPHMIVKALASETLPIYGDGQNVRDWLFVDDHARALAIVLALGTVGETYNIGGRNERTNHYLAERICNLLDHARPMPDGRSRRRLITFVADRPGHDRRYAIDASKLERKLGWRAQETFESGLEKTVAWYLSHEAWWRDILGRRYRAERIGLTTDLEAHQSPSLAPEIPDNAIEALPAG